MLHCAQKFLFNQLVLFVLIISFYMFGLGKH